MRVNAINALGAIHQHPEIVVPVLSNLLTSNPIVASQAASAMRCFGTNAASAIPALRNYPTNSTSFSQTQVMLTLAELAPEASAEIIVPYCIKTIGSDRINESTCVQILWRVGAPAGNVVPALIKLSAEKTSAGLAAPYALTPKVFSPPPRNWRISSSGRRRWARRAFPISPIWLRIVQYQAIPLTKRFAQRTRWVRWDRLPQAPSRSWKRPQPIPNPISGRRQRLR
jgi:hypothetical protein